MRTPTRRASGGSRATFPSGGGLHIHHVVIGVILVMISGVSMVTLGVNGGVPEFTVAATFFGVGAALVLDEFALILHLQDVYWAEDGRTSVDAVFAAVAVAGLLVLGFNPLSFFDIGIWRNDHSIAARASVIALAVLTLAARRHRASEGQGVDRAGGDVHHPAALHRRDTAVPSARTLGPLAVRRPAQEDAQGTGPRTHGCGGRWCRRSSGCSTSSRVSRTSPKTAEVDQELDREIHAAPAPERTAAGVSGA